LSCSSFTSLSCNQDLMNYQSTTDGIFCFIGLSRYQLFSGISAFST
jgi:hypothetical protein